MFIILSTLTRVIITVITVKLANSIRSIGNGNNNHSINLNKIHSKFKITCIQRSPYMLWNVFIFIMLDPSH